MAVKAADQISIVDVTDAYSVTLTSEAYTFVGGTGGVASGASCSTQAVAYCGTSRCDTVSIGTVTCPTGISSSVSNNNSNSPTITFTTTAIVSTACEATIPVTVDGITINKKFSFAVAKTGSQGNPGAAGRGIASTTVTYQVGSSGTSAPTGTWSSNPVATTAGQFLWTKTVTTYTSGDPTTTYSVAAHGATGAKGDTGATGKGISSTVVTYQVGTSATSAPTGTWSSNPVATTEGKYLWTRTVITYSDSTSTTTYSVAAHGAKGNQGNPGADAITMSITSSNGTVLKNSSGSTVLTAHVFKAGTEQTITDAGVCGSLGSVKWYKAGTTNAIATAKSITVSAADITNVAAYTCQLEG